MARLSDAAAARLRIAMRPHKITLPQLAEALDVSRSTAHRILAGEADLPPRFDLFVTTRLGITAEAILEGEQAMPDSVVEVPIFDIEFAAGPGRVAFADEQAVGHWPFPADWLAQFGAGDFKLVRVAGDSQEPELRDRDLVMINTADQRVRDGMAAVRVDDRLLIKRVQVQGSTARLRSANPAYEDIVVDLAADEFAVIARALCAVKLL